jgi:hypothetical protein
MKKLSTILLSVFVLLISQNVMAQGGIGASYEIRDDQPKEGIGLRLEKSFGDNQSLVNFGIVGHTSFFSNTITLRNNDNGSGLIFSDTDLSTFDFGAALKVAANIPMVTPYIMGGLGFENYKIRVNSTFDGLDFPRDERTLMVNGTLGVQLRLINSIRPFAEVRFSQNFKDYEFEDTFDDIKASRNRYAFGVMLQF